MMTEKACGYFKKSGVGLTADTRHLTEVADLLMMRTWGTPTFDSTSNVQVKLVWDPLTNLANASVEPHNIFLELNEDDKLRAQRFAEAWTASPFVYDAATQRCASARAPRSSIASHGTSNQALHAAPLTCRTLCAG